MPGSGKSSVGRALAERCRLPFADLDAEIEKEQAIEDIFAEGGEPLFRQKEEEALRRLLSEAPENLVLALGGGTLSGEGARLLVEQKCFCIYLQASPAVLAERLSGKGEKVRPLLGGKAGEAEIARLLEERKNTYEACASLIFDADSPTPAEAAETICNKLKIK